MCARLEWQFSRWARASLTVANEVSKLQRAGFGRPGQSRPQPICCRSLAGAFRPRQGLRTATAVVANDWVPIKLVAGLVDEIETVMQFGLVEVLVLDLEPI